jgi:glycerol-3-phosphate acyltransferase PlsY
MKNVFLFIGAYLLGAIPFAVVIGRLKGVDILKTGSGNPGMTNVMRALGPGWGGATFVLDVAKGLIPTLIARQTVTGPIGVFDAQFLWFLVGLCAIIGHCVSPFLSFRGGKGVSTALGAIIGASPILAALCFGLFLILLAATRYMGVASSVAVSSVLIFNFLVPGQSVQLVPIYGLLVTFVLYRHRANFVRMRAGIEPKFSFRRVAEAKQPADSVQNREDIEIDPSKPVNEASVPDRLSGETPTSRFP